jgi:hypothetical protein
MDAARLISPAMQFEWLDRWAALHDRDARLARANARRQRLSMDRLMFDTIMQRLRASDTCGVVVAKLKWFAGTCETPCRSQIKSRGAGQATAVSLWREPSQARRRYVRPSALMSETGDQGVPYVVMRAIYESCILPRPTEEGDER